MPFLKLGFGIGKNPQKTSYVWYDADELYTFKPTDVLL